MKVFFTASPRALNSLQKEYKSIFNTIKELGHSNVSNLIVNINPDYFYKATPKEVADIYKNVMRDLSQADVLIVEISTHSMSMGFLVNKSLELGKPVIALHTKGNEPFFFSGIQNEKLQVIEYRFENIKSVLREALDFAQNMSDIRFNFIISPSLLEYLDWIAKTKKLPRSVYLRKLIELDREKNKEYQG